MNKTKLILGFLLLAAVAVAATEKVERDGSSYPLWLHKGIYVGPYNPDPTTSTTNKVTRMLATSEVVDYASQTITCADSTGVTLTGAQVGDACSVSYPAAPGNANFTCYVDAANHVKGHFCPAGTATDPASGTYNYYIRSNQ